MATITIYVPDQEPIELALDGYEQVSIGRGPDNDIVLDHVSMSGSHAVGGGPMQFGVDAELVPDLLALIARWALILKGFTCLPVPRI